MMEKVKLTQEQADAIDRLRAYDFEDALIMRRSKDMPFVYSSLDSLTVNDFGLIFFNLDSYEVEPEFKDDEWVVLNNGTVTQILTVKDCVFPYEFEKCFAHERGGDKWYDYKTIARHATPEEIKAEQERRVWAGIGREVNEIHAGDCVSLNGNYFKVFDNMGCPKWQNHISPEYAAELLEGGLVNGFYPAESFISFGGESHDN